MISTFISAASFAADAMTLRVGDPVSGFAECTNRKEHIGDPLTGWAAEFASEWHLLHPDSPRETIEINIDVVSVPPTHTHTVKRLKFRLGERSECHLRASQSPGPPEVLCVWRKPSGFRASDACGAGV